MKFIFCTTIVFCLALVFGSSVHAQNYAGTYNSIAGYVEGSNAGFFGYGVTTVSRKGVMAYSEYWPSLGETFGGYGSVAKNGRIRFTTDGVTGGGRFYNNRIAWGTFSDEGGSGYFGMAR